MRDLTKLQTVSGLAGARTKFGKSGKKFRTSRMAPQAIASDNKTIDPWQTKKFIKFIILLDRPIKD